MGLVGIGCYQDMDIKMIIQGIIDRFKVLFGDIFGDIFNPFTPESELYGRWVVIYGTKAKGNSKKQFKFYENVWTYYDDGKAYSLDIDGRIINRTGVPFKYTTESGLQIDDSQVNKDFYSKENINRKNRAYNKKRFIRQGGY